MSLKFDRPCSFFQKGNCNKGEDCPYSHDQKVELERNDQGKLVPKRGGGFRGRGRGREEKSRDYENNQEEENPQPRYNRNTQDNNSDRRGNSYERKPFERKPYERKPFKKNDQGVDSARWDKHDEQEEPKQEDSRNNRPYQKKPFDRNTHTNGFKKWERSNDNNDARNANTEPEEQVIVKRVKRNEIVVPKRDKMYKLEQIYEVDNFIHLLGYQHEFLGVLTSNEIQFFLIPFKRSWSDIIDEEKKVSIIHKDKVLLNGWLQEDQLIVQFQMEDDPIKNLLIFENVFQNQIPKVVLDIGVKNIVYCYMESGLLYTFCSDGLIRIFNQEANYKYINHYDLEQGIESVIKVGSNYLIGTRSAKLVLFDGQLATEIPFKTDMKCNQMVLDFNRVILKLDSITETHIYVLNQQLEVIGPLYKGGKVNTIEILKSYENEKLFLLIGDNSLDTFKEQGNKFYPLNNVNQAFNELRKMEITNENMVTQKYILGMKGNQLQLYSLIPEQ